MSDARARLAKLLADKKAKQQGADTTNNNEVTKDAGATTGTDVTVSDTGSNASDSGAEKVPEVPSYTSKVSFDDSSDPDVIAIKMKLAELEQMLHERVPEFRGLLKEIHTTMKNDPACVTAFDDDEISIVVEALARHANSEIVAPAAAKAAKKRSKVKVTVDDL